MKHINEYLDEPYNPDWENVVEIVTIGYPILNKKDHFIALHGTNAGDKERPHIHIYLDGDKGPLLEYIKEYGMKISDRFYKYFTEQDKKQYKECFK